MPLRLKIPALVDKPLISAETRPQKVSEFIEKLPIADPLEAATTLFEEMEILNRQKVSPDTRVKALELYRVVVKQISELLANSYSKASLPLPPQAKTLAGAAESLWLELGYGYKLALIDEQNKLFSLNSDKTNALILQRAIEAMGQLAMVYYKTYFATPSSVWGDLNQLYLYAVQQSLHEIEVATGENTKSTPSLSFKQALLMSLAYPRHLAPIDIRRVEDYVVRNAKYVRLQDAGLLENPAGIFLVSLNSDNPPISYIKNAKDPLGPGDVILITIDLARLVHKHIQLIQSGNPIPPDELPIDAKDPRYIDTLTYLIKHWGASPKRIFNRSRKSDGIRLAVGINAVHYFIHGEKHYTGPANEENTDELSTYSLGNAQTTTPEEIIPSRWLVTNISAGGMALRKLANPKDSIRVGDLLAVKDDKAQSWALGVVRWVSNDEQEQLDIGAHLIAPAAKAAGVCKSDRRIFEKVILLPSVHTLKQSASMIAPSGIYSPARVLDLDEDGKISRIMITKLIERTTSFERFGFSYL
ncbi:hypothetical protein A7981_02130 [Methylovorus sp. MM2]|uniref:hypothetical protein n=1 Tax=Methylovorus sp. MM2 TaxID=1848038 RepID=UPI0007E29ABA|nr:hypothetical protein [Methylovorus sp. MM2]OAM52307.1 hypothetical protein A7981_02130 [Methylovorus sp. MM2]